MKKLLILSSIILFALLNSFAQKQAKFYFFSARVGMTSNFNIVPPYKPRLFLVESPITLFPAPKEFNFTKGMNVDLNFQYDLSTMNLRFITGLQWTRFGFKSKYKTKLGDSSLVEFNQMSAIAMPFLVKISGIGDMFNEQSYIFVGIQVDKNLKLKRYRQPSWSEKQTIIGTSDDYNAYTYMYVVGLNYFIYNIEINYIPKTYMKLTGNNWGLPDRMFLVKLALHIPVSRWSLEKMKNFKREVKRNKSKRF